VATRNGSDARCCKRCEEPAMLDVKPIHNPDHPEFTRHGNAYLFDAERKRIVAQVSVANQGKGLRVSATILDIEVLDDTEAVSIASWLEPRLLAFHAEVEEVLARRRVMRGVSGDCPPVEP
jgi:hypothetical protein